MATILTATTAAYTAQVLRGTAKVDEVARADSEVDTYCTADWANDVDADLESINSWLVGSSSAGIAGNTTTLLGGLTVNENVTIGTGQARTLTLDTGAAATSGFYFDDGTNATDGGTVYNTSTNQMVLRAANADQVSLADGFFFPTVDDDIFLGGSSNAFSGLYLKDGITPPGTPTTGAVIYVDTTGGDLKVKFSDGFVATIAADA